jgi:hypothetical protein
MRILFAFLVMGMVATFVVVLVAVQTLISLLPLLIAALLVVGAVRFWEKGRGVPVPAPPAPSRQPARTRPAAQARAIPPQPVAWLMVPVWPDWTIPGPTQQPPPVVVDAEVIDEAEHRG